MRTWTLPFVACCVMAVASYHVTLVATPFALMRLATTRVGKGLSVNEFHFAPMTTASNQTIVRPSPDLAYSLCIFDVSKAPVLVYAEPIPGHYWSVSIFDARTDVAAVLSDRDTNAEPARLAILRPGQIGRSGFSPVYVGYDRGIVLLRILLEDKLEYDRIDVLRRKSYCRPA